jgi:hypothetical protein
MIADILNPLAAAATTDLRPLQIKLTYVGTQKKPVPTVAFGTFHHVLVMDWFLELRTPGLHYDNDGIAVWNFTVTPEEMSRVVKTLAAPGLLTESGDEPESCLSVMVSVKGSRIGDLGCEALLGRGRCAIVIDSVRGVLDSNQIATHVMDLQRQLVCP